MHLTYSNFKDRIFYTHWSVSILLSEREYIPHI